MKKILFILSVFISSFVVAQTSQVSYQVASIAAMKAYPGIYVNRIHVVATNEDYVSCPACTADEVTIYAGAGSRKWKKVTDYLKANASDLTSHTGNTSNPHSVTKTQVGLSNVDNTSDASKPVSTAQQTALDLKANLASPTFTGTPTLPIGTIGTTQSAGNSTTALATTAFVTTADNLKANLASPTFTGTVVIPTPFTLGAVSVLPTGTELNYVDGVTSAIQTQIDTKAPLASPTFTGVPAAPTAAAATNTTQLATTAHVFAERSNTFSLTNKTIDGDLNTLLDIPVSAILTADTEEFDPADYALLAGRASGQTINGGTAANEDLILDGTSDGTRTTSYIIMQPTAGNVGIGNSTPTEKLDVAGNILIKSGNYLQVNSSDNLGSAQIFADGSYNSILRSGGNNVNLQAAGGIGFQTYTASTYNDKVTISNAGVLGITVAPTTSAGTYDFLSRNTSTGVVEKIASSGIVTTTSTNTLTNKRWTARVGSTTSSATPTINTDNFDIYKLTAQAEAITSFTTNLTGTPVDGDVLEIQVTGTAARALTFGASFVSSTVTIPTTTVTTATLTIIFQYFTTSSYGNNKWVCVNSF